MVLKPGDSPQSHISVVIWLYDELYVFKSWKRLLIVKICWVISDRFENLERNSWYSLKISNPNDFHHLKYIDCNLSGCWSKRFLGLALLTLLRYHWVSPYYQILYIPDSYNFVTTHSKLLLLAKPLTWPQSMDWDMSTASSWRWKPPLKRTWFCEVGLSMSETKCSTNSSVRRHEDQLRGPCH